MPGCPHGQQRCPERNAPFVQAPSLLKCIYTGQIKPKAFRAPRSTTSGACKPRAHEKLQTQENVPQHPLRERTPWISPPRRRFETVFLSSQQEVESFQSTDRNNSSSSSAGSRDDNAGKEKTGVEAKPGGVSKLPGSHRIQGRKGA